VRYRFHIESSRLGFKHRLDVVFFGGIAAVVVVSVAYTIRLCSCLFWDFQRVSFIVSSRHHAAPQLSISAESVCANQDPSEFTQGAFRWAFEPPRPMCVSTL
jgi:hypothetical protein